MIFLGSNEEFAFQTLVLQLTPHELVIMEQCMSYLLNNDDENELQKIQDLSEDEDYTGYEALESQRDQLRFIIYRYKIKTELTSDELDKWKYANNFDEYYEV